MKKVLKIVPSDFTNESRDLREILSLCQQNYDVVVYAIHQEGIPEFEEKEFQLHRFVLNPPRAKGMMNKLFRYKSFALQCIKNGKRFNPDIISAHDLPALMIGYLIKKISKYPCMLIYDSHELTSEMASNRHQSKWIVAMKKIAEKIFIHKADRVMVVSESIADYNYKQFGLKERPWVIKNIPQRQVNKKRHDYFREIFDIRQSDRILLYQGVIGKGRGVNILIDALKYLDEHIVVVLMGYGEVEEVLQYATDNHVGHRVFYKESVPYNQLLEYSSSADIGICLIENYCLSYYFCLPNKLFEYIQSGIPVLCSDFPDMKSVVLDYGIGVTANPEDDKAIAEAISKMLNEDAYNSYLANIPAAQAEFNWERESSKLLEMYNSLTE